jgi:hypothetical protein
MFFKTRKTLGILLLACLLIFGTIPFAFAGVIGDIDLNKIYNNPDEKWKDTAIKDSVVVNNDMESIVAPALNNDWPALSKCADKIAADSQTALDNSDSYTVSGSFTQTLKYEYNLAMEQAIQAAKYIKLGIEEAKEGNSEGATSDFYQAGEYKRSYYQHIKFVYKNIHALHCTRMYNLCIHGNNFKCRDQYKKCLDQIV